MTETTQSETVATTSDGVEYTIEFLDFLVGTLGTDRAYEALMRKPAWHAPTITRLDVTRTMAWCGSGGDSHD